MLASQSLILGKLQYFVSQKITAQQSPARPTIKYLLKAGKQVELALGVWTAEGKVSMTNTTSK